MGLPGPKGAKWNRTRPWAVALATAAAVVSFRVTGRQVEGSRTKRTKDILDDVAHAMSNIVPIHRPDGAGVTALTPIELMHGKFARGAQVFRAHDGTEIGGLTVQRRDMAEAISILRPARIRFERP